MIKRKLVVLGAGGFGREVAWQVSQIQSLTAAYEVLGFVEDSPEPAGNEINGLPVLGDTQWLLSYPEELSVVICIGNSRIRKQVYERLSTNPRLSYPTIIADNVRYSDTVTFGQGCIICLSSILTVNVQLGDFVIINLDCTIGHDVEMDNFVTLYPSVNVSGNVHIGECAELGTGCQIIQKKTVGRNTIIGAGSVVVKDLPADCTAVGAPALPIKFHPPGK